MSAGPRPRPRIRPKTQASAPKTGTRQIVVFALGDDEYAFPIERVQEIVRYMRPRSIASRVSWALGVINLRGRVVLINDLAARLGAKSTASDRAKIIIIQSAGQVRGVVVDDVKEVRTISEQDLEGVPSADTAVVDAVAKVGERLVILLKLDSLFDAPG